MPGRKTNPLEKFLQGPQPHSLPPCVVLDGGLATELENRGACLKDPLWSAKLLAEDPDLIREVHRDYFFAGADVATTASYQASHEAFQRRGHTEEQASGLMVRSVTLACQARDEFWAAGPWPGREFPLVVASVGSYGAFLADGSEYRGNYAATQEELKAFHRLRLAVLAETEADLVAIETIPCLREAQAILELMAEEFPHLWAWLCFSGRDDAHVSEGQTLADCAALADKYPQCVAVGINCSAPRYILPLLKSASKVTKKPLVAYPNSGETWDGLNKVWLHGDGEENSGYASMVPAWVNAGARLIGGCCRTTPDTIFSISQILRSTPVETWGRRPLPTQINAKDVHSPEECRCHPHS